MNTKGRIHRRLIVSDSESSASSASSTASSVLSPPALRTKEDWERFQYLRIKKEGDTERGAKLAAEKKAQAFVERACDGSHADPTSRFYNIDNRYRRSQPQSRKSLAAEDGIKKNAKEGQPLEVLQIPDRLQEERAVRRRWLVLLWLL